MEPFEHAYTNRTFRDGGVVIKEYLGPDLEDRRIRETAVLRALDGVIPVPVVLESDRDRLLTGFVSGTHGKDLVARGFADPVLTACGGVLQRIHAIDPRTVFGDTSSTAAVVVHGDYGPNNVLLDHETMRVVAVVDWEWCHLGPRVEDVAWCEWVVRTFHPDHVGALDGFFAAYGDKPGWLTRQAAMVAKLEQLYTFAEQRDPGGPLVATRARQLVVTEAWVE